ncbi:MAG: hypothetical protein KatS3mg103_0831 [Phycisphaerales bacterium]|nr:MAG: hypothetical protein KatS3mg103_0831 [Phycisphaerales bacterium]
MPCRPDGRTRRVAAPSQGQHRNQDADFARALAGGDRRRACGRFWQHDGRRLGLFAPMQSLRSRRCAGVGDLADLGELCAWAGDRGVSLVGTLPMLAGWHREPADGSPYTPLSRSVFGELFLDLDAFMTDAERAQARELAGQRWIDYGACWSLKRGVLARGLRLGQRVAA